MPQSFRLRLGDGTILMVDHGGLSTWESDPTAAVGTKNPNKWIPLKEFLVQERAEAFRRAREGEPEAPPTETSATVREDGLPLIPPPSPREDGSDPHDIPSLPREEAPLPAPPEGAVSLEIPVSAAGPKLGADAVPGDMFVPEEPRSLDPPPRDADEGARGATLPESAEPVPVALIAQEAGPAALAAVPAPPVPIAEEIDLETLAAESMASSAVVPPSAPIEELPVIPLRPLGDEAPVPPDAPSGPEPVASPEEPGVRAHADDPASASSAWSRRARARDEDPDPEPGEPVRMPVLAAAVLQWTGLLGVGLSRCLAPINRLEQGLPLFGFDVPGAPLESHASRGGEISIPTFELDFGAVRSRASSALHLDAMRARTASALQELPSRTRGWLDGFTSRVSSLAARGARPEEAVAPSLPVPQSLDPLSEGPASSSAPVQSPAAFAEKPLVRPAPAGEPTVVVPAASAPSSVSPRREGRRPPPMATELPALRLAPTHEPRPVGDVYAGDGGAGGSFGSSIRLWTQRFLLTAAVLAGGALAGQHWDTWFPVAGDMGGTLFSEIDDRVRWWHLARERQAVIDQASEQFPHLARDTVGLVLSTNRTHILEPPALFETAWGAAERGASKLTASEVEELERLRQELLEELPPLDRERLRTFGRAHAQGAVFPFDAQRGLLAFARGARALPPERRERLQTLLGKAIAAGLAS